MKSKQEVIQEAWGETVYPGLDMDMKLWDEDDDGWYDHWKETGKVYRNFLNDHNKRFIDLRNDIINLNGWFWPKEIDGIETNNGWTRIESEEDLPKEDGTYYVMTKDGMKSLYWMNGMGKRYNVKKWMEYKPTHYQLEVVPKPLIY